MGAMRRGNSAFTLIELLVVISIIVILIALLQPALGKARGRARVTICATQLHQLHIGILDYQSIYRTDTPWEFANGSGDHPHESGSAPGRPGTPARALHSLTRAITDPKLFFCPDVPIDPHKWYHPQPNSSFTKFHGSYAYYYQHVLASEDRTPAGNGILFSNSDSREVIMVDATLDTWTGWGFPYQYPHYNALMLQGDVKLVTTDQQEVLYWLWGPARRPY